MTLHLRIHPTIHKNQIPTNSVQRTKQGLLFLSLSTVTSFFSHPDWVNNISYPPGYVIPYFQVYAGEGKPYEHLVLFLHRCGDRARSEALCLPSISIIIDRCGLALLTCMA